MTDLTEEDTKLIALAKQARARIQASRGRSRPR